MSEVPIPKKRFYCTNCGRVIEVPFGAPKPYQCPYCGAHHTMIHRLDRGGFGRCWRGGRTFTQKTSFP